MTKEEKDFSASDHFEGGVAVVDNREEETEPNSDCCSALPFGETFIEEDMTGICSECYDGANFTYIYLDSGIEVIK
jgi:hypothetical protein